MRQIGFDQRFTLLAQEAHLTKNSILSGFDLLLKANFFQDKEGYFYSSFFHIAIGMERMLKLSVVTHHMLTNDYKTPTISELKNKFRHNIDTLYGSAQQLIPLYRPSGEAPNALNEIDQSIVSFFSEYASHSRYFNLNEICESQSARNPLYVWLDILRSVYEDNTPGRIRQKSAMSIMYRMDREGPPNNFTRHLDENGHPIMAFDCFHRQFIVSKSAPLMIWRIIQILKPIHYLLWGMSEKASEYEAANNFPNMTIPHYEDFFYFLLADKESTKRRKKWLEIFNN